MYSLPTLTDTERSRTYQTEFKGYNHNLVIADEEFYDMENMTSDYYPALSPRLQRGVLETITNCHGLFSADKLLWVSGTTLYYNSVSVCTVSDTDKTFCKMGAKVLVMPDKIVVNTGASPVTWETVEKTYTHACAGASATFTPCRLSDAANITYVSGTTEPSDHSAYWLDTTVTPHVVKIYSTTYSRWEQVTSTYVKISASGIDDNFNLYDTVTISGCDDGNDPNTLADLNSDMVIWGKGTDYVIVVGLISGSVTQSSGTIQLQRKMPDLEYMTESGNRIWGCNSTTHEIYACKQGDPLNWYNYMGIASDSYAVTVGSSGLFTGATTYLGYVLFFKEDRLIKIYGSQPSEYTLSDVECRGVENGSANSLCIVNETLFYKSMYGVMAFDGSTPTCVSDALGNEEYQNATACEYKSKYFVSMQDKRAVWHIFNYDYTNGLWVHEDDTQAKWYTSLEGCMYYIDADNHLICADSERLEYPMYPKISDTDLVTAARSSTAPADTTVWWVDTSVTPNVLKTYSGTAWASVTDGVILTDIDDIPNGQVNLSHVICPASGQYPDMSMAGTMESQIEWFVETGDIGLTTPDFKYISKIQIRCEVDEGATIQVHTQYDSSGAWDLAYVFTPQRKRSLMIPIRIKRCDHMRLKISGKGLVKVYSLAKTFEEGSEC